MPPPSLMKRASTYEPPDGKLSPDCFDLPFREGGIVWVVAVDGSDTSMRAARLASFLMNAKAKKVDKGRDAVLIVNVVKPGSAVPEALFGNCVNELRSCGLNTLSQVHCTPIQLPNENWGVGDALVYFANHVNMGRARLLIGGAGMHNDKGKWSKLGSIAEQCLAKVKVPVVLVRGSWGTDVHGDRNPLGRPIRQGKEAGSGLNILCCIDGTNTGDHAFDLATTLCREGDALSALHVETVSDNAAHANDRMSAVEQKYTTECTKVSDSMGLAACRYLQVHAGKGMAISEPIIEASHDCDLLVMGTVELLNIKKRHILGSIAMHIAAAAHGHMMVVKNYAL